MAWSSRCGSVDVICRTEFHVASQYSCIRPMLPEKITFVTSEELYHRWPDAKAGIPLL